MDCFATFAKSTLRIRLFWRNCKKWENNLPDSLDDLLSCLETILHGNHIVFNKNKQKILVNFLPLVKKLWKFEFVELDPVSYSFLRKILLSNENSKEKVLLLRIVVAAILSTNIIAWPVSQLKVQLFWEGHKYLHNLPHVWTFTK